ncbi:MAG: 16S rRNA (guanine(966)-N(2))-methyltransferase RsmD [Alphaproteobacteria bacterium]|nr:16S rRNA (guanine(966)-N(2))-methyltransferase RsmD [Pseudomonadota bacterium]TDI65950.1 MAG: 16S rRNA (guanine(966)-N(2))-methyltransferase RsmD [Alphaproteobacteria bacterium]
MRIIAGRHKGRALAAPKGDKTRPTAARAREGLFNMLAHGGYGPGRSSAIGGASVLDAFAGTGAFAFEALSRGAASATLLEIDPRAIDAARDNAAALGELDRTSIRRMDATRPRAAATAHGLVFADPPYGRGLAAKALAALAHQGWIATGAMVIVEVAESEQFSPPERFALLTQRTSGAARFVLMRYGGIGGEGGG